MNCSFCGRYQDERFKFIANPSGDVFICETCVEICEDILKAPKQKFNAKKSLIPEEIRKYLDDYIIGQDDAKKTLSVAVYNHYKRVAINSKKDEEIKLDKSNVLMVGPTGVGKTLIAKTLAKILDVPFASCDATILTEAGYVGEDVESVLTKLLKNADFDVSKAERGIVYIDEIDKIAKKSENKSLPKDPSGEGVQQGLLKMMEGTVVNIPTSNGKRFPGQETVSLSTENILFICGGAFVGLDKLIEKRMSSKSLGFNGEIENKISIEDKVETQDLIDFGLIPEFVGRLPVVVELKELKEEDLIKILVEPKNSLVKQYTKLFKLEGVDLEVKESALKNIAQSAIKLKSGARALRSILEKSLLDVMYKLPSDKTIKRVLLKDENGKLVPQYLRKQKVAYKN